MFEEILLESFIAVGTIAFAMSGSFKAIRHELDVFGVLVLGFSTALGGGLIRDALVHRTPSAFIELSPAVYALIGCLIVHRAHAGDLCAGRVPDRDIFPVVFPTADAEVGKP